MEDSDAVGTEKQAGFPLTGAEILQRRGRGLGRQDGQRRTCKIIRNIVIKIYCIGAYILSPTSGTIVQYTGYHGRYYN